MIANEIPVFYLGVRSILFLIISAVFLMVNLSARCFAIFAADESVTVAVEALQRRYALVNSITAQFRQTYRAPGVSQSESGQLWMKKPGLMRWEYRNPETKLFIADGHDTYLFVPEDRQVLIRAFSVADLHGTPLQFLLGQGEILKSFSASWETEWKPTTPRSCLIRLTPRSPEPDYEYLVIECDSSTQDVLRMVIRERTGGTSEFIFADMATNVKTDKKQFRFDMPKGVEIIRLDEK